MAIESRPKVMLARPGRPGEFNGDRLGRRHSAQREDRFRWSSSGTTMRPSKPWGFRSGTLTPTPEPAGYCAGDVAGERGDRASRPSTAGTPTRPCVPEAWPPRSTSGHARDPTMPQTYRGHEGVQATSSHLGPLPGLPCSRVEESSMRAMTRLWTWVRWTGRGGAPASGRIGAAGLTSATREAVADESLQTERPSKQSGCRSRRCRRRTSRRCAAGRRL